MLQLKQAIGRAAEGCWRLGFTALGTQLTPVARWHSPGGQRVLVVAPHPDDEMIGCAGVLALHQQAGDDLTLVWVTDGRRSRAGGLGPAAMAQQRQHEAWASATVLGLRAQHWLGLPEGGWQPAELRTRLAPLLARANPQLIYAPSLVDFHPEHVRVARALARTLADMALDSHGTMLVRMYQIQVPLTPLLTNLVADVSLVMPLVTSALAAYTSQQGSVLCSYRQRRYNAAWHHAGQHAEAFWQVSVRHYCQLHLTPAAPAGRFRSLRGNALSDPLAYLVGLAARRQLKDLTTAQR